MKTYSTLSKIPFLRHNYSAKFLFLAFIGIHIPLIGLVFYVLMVPNVDKLEIISLTLVLTLVSTLATLYLIRLLLAPLNWSRNSLDEFLKNKTLPEKPISFHDEAGQIQEKIYKTIHQLNQLLEDKNDFISLLSHDLRSPLIQINSVIEIIKLEGYDHPLLVEIQGLSESYLNILRTLLSALKHDESISSLPKIEVSAKQLINEICTHHKISLGKKNLTLHNNTESNDILYCMPNLLGEVLSNLISNAIKFSYEGSEIHIYIEKDPSNHITFIVVQDFGMGMDPEVSSNLFKKFSKGRMGTGKEKSFGLGLYLSQKLIHLQGGSILAESDGPNKGSRFKIALP